MLSLASQRNTVSSDGNTPIEPQQVLARQLEGLTQEEIRDDAARRGLAEYPAVALLSALLREWGISGPGRRVPCR